MRVELADEVQTGTQTINVASHKHALSNTMIHTIGLTVKLVQLLLYMKLEIKF